VLGGTERGGIMAGGGAGMLCRGKKEGGKDEGFGLEGGRKSDRCLQVSAGREAPGQKVRGGGREKDRDMGKRRDCNMAGTRRGPGNS